MANKRLVQVYKSIKLTVNLYELFVNRSMPPPHGHQCQILIFVFHVFPHMYISISVFAMFVIHILYAHVVLYLRAPWKIGESQMGHPRKIKNLLTYLRG